MENSKTFTQRETMTSVQFVLLILLDILTCFVKADIPLTSQTAGGSDATSTKSVQNYKYVFSTWKANRFQTPMVQLFDLCLPCVCDRDIQCIIPPHRGENSFADWPGKPQFRTFPPPLPASPGLPRTAADAPGTSRRSVIVRATPTSTLQSNADIRLKDTEDQQKQDGLVDKLKHKFMPSIGAPTIVNDDPDEITKTFYTYSLSGYHPVVIPLIVSSGTSNSPMTILAWAGSTHFSSFISSSLIADLNRSSEIRAVIEPPLYTPERNLTYILGYDSKRLGQISLDIVIGSRDRMIQDLNFTVFADEEDPQGAWRPDLFIGIDFLNTISGIKLTEEYSGDDKAGAKEGLPVLVQRVFVGDFQEDGLKREKVEIRDEL